MKHRYVIPAVIAMSIATAGFAYAQGSAAVGNNSGAAGTNNTSPDARPSSTPGTNTTVTPSNTSLGTATTVPSNGTRSTGNNKDASNSAVNTASQNNPGAPVPGANSFTEGQARSRIQDHGFSQVTDLKLDNQGIWRGKAMRDGKSVDVAMDYQGNVVAK
jgi:hypothetical protein